MARTRGCIWLVAGLIVAALAGFVAYVTLTRATVARTTGGGAAGPVVSVVVAARAVEVRTQLTALDLQKKDLPVEAVPQGAVRDVAQAEGRVTLVDLYPGEVILAQRLVRPDTVTANGRFALVLAEDQVLMAFPAGDLMSRVGVLKPGDHVDILFSLDFPANRSVAALGAAGGAGGGNNEEEQATFNLLQNVTVAAIVVQRPAATRATTTGITAAATPTPRPDAAPAVPQTPPEALLLTVAPQDALLLKYALDAGGKVDIVLRAPGVEQPFEVEVEPVDVDYVINKFRIPTQVGR